MDSCNFFSNQAVHHKVARAQSLSHSLEAPLDLHQHNALEVLAPVFLQRKQTLRLPNFLLNLSVIDREMRNARLSLHEVVHKPHVLLADIRFLPQQDVAAERPPHGQSLLHSRGIHDRDLYRLNSRLASHKPELLLVDDPRAAQGQVNQRAVSVHEARRSEDACAAARREEGVSAASAAAEANIGEA